MLGALIVAAASGFSGPPAPLFRGSNSLKEASRPSGFRLAAAALKQQRREGQAPDYDIIIYGGGPQAVAAALKASAVTGDYARILMIVPEEAPGSIMTVGKQNLFDLNYYRSAHLPAALPADYEGTQGGTLYRFLRDMGPVFSPRDMALYLQRRMAAHSNITVWYRTELTEVALQPAPGPGTGTAIKAIRVQPISRNGMGWYRYTGTRTRPLHARIFIDASETGRLVRLAGVDYAVGREDQGADKRQMGATLMYKIRGVNVYKAVKADPKRYGYALSSQGALQFWAGDEAFRIPEMIAFDRSSPHFRIKGYNAGEEGISKAFDDTRRMEFWMNQILIYNVDARKAWRDKAAENGLYPDSGGLDPEMARDMAADMLARPEFIRMVRQLPGFGEAELVMRGGKPEIGGMLYLRESIHTVRRGEDRRFALTKRDVLNGGETYFPRRIGIGYYNFDSNTYTKDESLSNPLHKPWYVPYEVLTTPQVANLLIPGYAASIDSFAWTAMRVYPNLIMLGDAAGTAAGLSLTGEFHLQRPTASEMEELHRALRAENAILEK